MLELVQVFGVGMLISFLGQLPFGNMNLTATQLSVQEGHASAWKYAAGIALVEIIYLRLALTGMDWVTEHKTIFIVMGWLTVVVFMALGIIGFISSRKQSKERKGMLLNNKINRFLLGLSISAINPAQIPFWFLWGTQMIQNRVLQPTFSQYNIFTAG
ncbi:MAG TPA: LysE family transporter, partial [Chitinophagaceae bacterium]|nr:LysE family transporter [Chitinophagaceae bacterium]